MIKDLCSNASLHYDDKIIKNNDIFDVILPDGGAFMFFRSAFFQDMSGDNIISLIEADNFFKPWSDKNGFRWDIPLFNPSPRKEWEKLVWINRLYFLLPIAHKYYCSKDEKYALLWLKWFNKFNDEMMGKSEDTFYSILFSDMQVTWRFLSVAYSVILLKDSKTIKENDKKLIYKFLDWHIDRIYNEATATINYDGARDGGNHFEQKGLALLIAGILFKSDRREEFIALGRKILRIHIDNETFPDGGNVENCPSYSAFIVRMQLDAYFLLKNNGLTVPEDVVNKIYNQYKFLYFTSTSDLKSLQINDSFSLDLKKELNFVNNIFPLDFWINKNKRGNVLFEKSGFAVLRNDKFEIFVSCKDNTIRIASYNCPEYSI